MKKIVNTKNAPSPIGPYNQAVQYGDLLFVSGQIPLDPETGKLIVAGVAEETHMVMKNLQAVLAEAGMTFDNVLKASIFISDMKNFATINEVYGSYLTPNNEPARETVEVARLPKDVNVEISVVAGK